MINKNVLKLITGLVLTVGFGANAQALAKYELTVTNGSAMPLSPPVVYTKTGAEAAAQVGEAPTAGFSQVCQTGNATTRLNELHADSSVRFVTQFPGMIFPGETKVIEIEVIEPQNQSIHFEAMYGKSKNVCGISSINSHSLVALKQRVTSEVIQKDNTVLTGIFLDPALPAGKTFLDSGICANATDAISCLRELSVANREPAKIRFFQGYIPSVVMALETKFGATDTQTLLFPTSGAIQLKLKLKH